MPQPNVDLGGSSNFVSHPKKKKKQATDWTDTPADESKDGGGVGQEGDANGEGAAGGQGGGGAGDNNGDGGAGDGGDGEWNVGGGKKNKKKSKNAVEEEERRKREEEAAAQAQREEEDAAADPAGTFSWADDADADANDDFGFLSTKKVKKGEEANADAENDMGFTTSKKKGKKDKKSKVVYWFRRELSALMVCRLE